MIDIFLPAFLLSIILLGIHSYFGIEIIKKGIIFTDLAIGQFAALGSAISLFLWDGKYVYPISLIFALISGLIIALISNKKYQYTEAVIGLMYALGLSGIFILLSKSPHGIEEFQNLMAADILFTEQTEIIKTAIIYAVLGLMLFFIMNKLSGVVKEVAFFIVFSITVTSSVKLAGVLIVFSLLIAPALISLSFDKGNKIINAWIIGSIINFLAIYLSFKFDYPTGYTVVFMQSISALILVSLLNIKKLNSN